jgi:hypothetical protein
MFNYERISEACKGLALGEVYNYGQIVHYVHQVTLISESSIVPSDYCYNKTNKGADGKRFTKWPRLFVYEDDDSYRYLGEGYQYNGKVTYASNGEEYGFWIDGKFKRK